VSNAVEPGHRDFETLRFLEKRLRVSLAIVAIPERMPDAVAAFDLNCRALAAAEVALTLGRVVDVTGADGGGLAVLAVFPQVRAEVGPKRIIGRRRLRMKSRWDAIWGSKGDRVGFKKSCSDGRAADFRPMAGNSTAQGAL